MTGLDIAKSQIAPDGCVRAAINLSNFLLVSGPGGPLGWQGVAPDLALALATRLDARLELVPYATPSQIADAAGTQAWTIALLGAEPARAATIAFSPGYAEIEASYLVPPHSSLSRLEDVDQPGVRILAFRGSAYGLWLEANLQHATLLHARSFADAFDRFRAGEADALASLQPKLLEDVQAWPGARILAGRFMTVHQAIGVAAGQHAAAAFIREFVDEVRSARLVEELVRKHRVAGLTATPAQAHA
jgi:polar amino acid transport system substrate-binding protein